MRRSVTTRKAYKSPKPSNNMVNTWSFILALLTLAIGFLAGFYLQPSVEIPACPACAACNPAVIEKPVYLECQDDPDIAEEEAEQYEEETGKKVYNYKTSWSCKEFLEGKGYFNFEKKEVVSHADTEDGCVVYYVMK